tara:strand:+ start:442 stop:1746 length:1305 start_codon:yes stop_codon:yes gene_type:complete
MSIRSTHTTRNLNSRKSSVPTVGKGVPLNARGEEGDISFRITPQGLKLYIKANGQWHGVKVGSSFDSLEKQINEIKVNVDSMQRFRLPSTYGVTGDFILDVSGDITLNADGGQVAIKDDTATHFKLDCDNTRFVMYDDQDEADLFSIQIAEHGATTISTVDDGADIAHLTLDADGDISLDAVLSNSGDAIGLKNAGTTFGAFQIHHSASWFYLYENGGASTTDHLSFKVAASGVSTIMTTDGAGTAADLLVDADGDITLDSATGKIYLKDNGGNYTPGSDYEIATKKYVDDAYQYDMQVTNFFATATSNYVPLPGYVIERTSLTSQNEYVCMVAPYNGTIEKIVFRSEAAHNGNLVFTVTKSSDGTEIPTTVSGIHSTSINIADDTTQHIDFTTGFALGGNSIVKGDIFAINVTTPSSPLDTNITVVLKWDITS